MADTHVVGIAGSLRDGSHTRTALGQALAESEQAGGSTELLDLRNFELPVYDGDQPEAGDAPALTARVRAADAIMLGTPVYHGSYASTLKTALDYCGFDEFEETTVGLLAVAGGGFPGAALEHLRSVCRTLNAWVLPHQVAIPNVRSVVESGTITDDDLAERTRELGRQVVQYADISPDPAASRRRSTTDTNR